MYRANAAFSRNHDNGMTCRLILHLAGIVLARTPAISTQRIVAISRIANALNVIISCVVICMA